MRKIVAYIAISLDGKIADSDFGVEWLDQVPNPEHTDYGYADFFAGIETTIMGNSTYRQVLGFGQPFPYASKTNYVLTRDRSQERDENVTFIYEDPVAAIGQIKAQPGNNIWLIGGGQVNSLCLKSGLLDELIVFVMPVVVGKGVSLFSDERHMRLLELKETKSYRSGVVELRYTVGSQLAPES